MQFFGLIPQRFLGVDIGTSAIKVVEVSSWAGRKKLESYGEIPASVLYKKPFRTFEKSTLLFSNEDLSRAIQAIIEEAGIKSKHIAFAVPDFSTFFTNFELPPMTEREIPQAVKAESRRHIPLPLSEVTLDWQIIPQLPSVNQSKNIRVLLVAVPNETINQYKMIAKGLDLEMIALEAEAFGTIRSLVSEKERGSIALIDIGGRSTSCSIIYRGLLRSSHSFDVSGGNFIERLSKGLAIDYVKAKELIKSHGILGGETDSKSASIKESLESVVNLMTNEIEDTFETFKSKEKVDVERIIISGGSANMPGLLDYFKERFPKKKIEMADSFAKLFCPPILSEELKVMGPSYAIAVGMALKGLE